MWNVDHYKISKLLKYIYNALFATVIKEGSIFLLTINATYLTYHRTNNLPTAHSQLLATARNMRKS